MASSRFHHNNAPSHPEDDGKDTRRFRMGSPQNSQTFQEDSRKTDPGRRKRPRLKDRHARFNSVAKVVAAGFIGLASTILVLIMLMRWVPVPTSAFMLRHLLHGKTTEYRWVDGASISPNIAIAVVAAEDQRFPDHRGFDFKAISDAIRENRWRSRPRGASTISQQVAKNLFLWPGHSFLRKGLEAGLTMAIELCWPKRRILEVYLNIAQFGPETFGVAAASRRYFFKPPGKLTPYEAALLAAVLPNPEKYRVSPPSPYVWQRAADIEEQIRLLGGPAYLSNLR